MIVNKLDKSMKDTMKKRTRTALIMLLYGLGILFCLTLTDKSSDGGSSYLTKDPHTHDVISFVFAIISVLGIAWISIFIAKELHRCFIDTKSKKQVAFIATCLLLIQLVPTFIGICPNYVEGHLNIDTVGVGFFVFISSGIVISLIAYPFLFLMVRNGMRPTSFNKVVFPLCVIGIAGAFGCIYYLAIVRYGTTIVILLVVVAGCDIMAYFAGVLFGKHRMAPVISPKKSGEGAIIGAIAAAGLAVLFIYLFSLAAPQKENSMDAAYNFFGTQFVNYFDNTTGKWEGGVSVGSIAIALTFVSICGDLFFSWIKRKNAIKDFGNSLPGHGGYLDRIDAFIFVVLVFTTITFCISISTTIYQVYSVDEANPHAFFPGGYWYQ